MLETLNMDVLMSRDDSREKVRPGTGREAGLGQGEGTRPWMVEDRAMQEQFPGIVSATTI